MQDYGNQETPWNVFVKESFLKIRRINFAKKRLANGNVETSYTNPVLMPLALGQMSFTFCLNPTRRQ